MSVSRSEGVYLLEASHKENFTNDGHALVRGLASTDEMAKYEPAIRKACLAHSTEKLDIEERDTYGKAFLQVTNLWTRDGSVREFVFNTRFAQVAAQLLGVDRVRLYHDQALFKEPGGGPTPWHQDQFYWPLDTDKTITMWMPLVDISVEMGVLKFASGSHKAGPAALIGISDESDLFYRRYLEDHGFAITSPGAMGAGDATFHRGWTIHSAGPNQTTDKMREVMTVIYFADDARVTKPQNDFQKADLAAFLDSRSAGELADGPLNPILS